MATGGSGLWADVEGKRFRDGERDCVGGVAAMGLAALAYFPLGPGYVKVLAADPE